MKASEGPPVTRKERHNNSFQFILFASINWKWAFFSNINVFNDHLMYHKTTRSYLEMIGNPEKFPKKKEWVKMCPRNVFSQIQRMFEPTRRQNKYNMLAAADSWKIKFYDTLHCNWKDAFCLLWASLNGKLWKRGDFVSQLFLQKIKAFCSETSKRAGC